MIPGYRSTNAAPVRKNTSAHTKNTAWKEEKKQNKRVGRNKATVLVSMHTLDDDGLYVNEELPHLMSSKPTHVRIY